MMRSNISKEQALEMIDELLSDEGCYSGEDFDPLLLEALNEECGNYTLEKLTVGEIVMWLHGIRDGLENFSYNPEWD